MEAAIESCLAARHYQVRGHELGRYLVHLTERVSQVDLEIDYNDRWFVIRYVDSENLRYERLADGTETIHRKYNTWVKNLADDIRVRRHQCRRPVPHPDRPSARRLMPRRLYLLARVGLAGLAFLSFGVGAVLLAWVVLPLARWRRRRAPPLERAAACQRWVQRSFVVLHGYMRACGLLHFEPRRVDARVPGARFVIVANHPTLVDVAALAATFGRLTCIAKRPIFRAPVVGAIVRACGYLDGGGDDVFAGADVVGQALERLAADMPVVVFPEGTGSPAGKAPPACILSSGARSKSLVGPACPCCPSSSAASPRRWARADRGTIFRLKRRSSH